MKGLREKKANEKRKRGGECLGVQAVLHKVGQAGKNSEEVTFPPGMKGMRTKNIPGKGKSKALRQA